MTYLDCYDSVWKGAVLFEVELAESDVSSNDKPENVFLQASRYSYLPVVLADIVVHFQQHAIEFSSDVWFESGGHPLRSTLPIGVLFDHYGTPGCPWKIIVHFQAFPSHFLLKCTNPEESEHFYFHSLKQALFQLHGSTRLFNELSVELQRELWKSVQRGERVRFDDVAKKLRPPALLESSQSNPSSIDSTAILNELKTVPMRLCQPDKPVVQKPVAIWRNYVQTESSSADLGDREPERQMRSLEDVLKQDFTEHYDCKDESKRIQCFAQGVEVPLDAPIYDLWHLMSHCDLYLYVIMRTVDR